MPWPLLLHTPHFQGCSHTTCSVPRFTHSAKPPFPLLVPYRSLLPDPRFSLGVRPPVCHPLPSMGAAPQLTGPDWLGPMRWTLCLCLAPACPSPLPQPHPIQRCLSLSGIPVGGFFFPPLCGERDTHFLSVFKATVGCCPQPQVWHFLASQAAQVSFQPSRDAGHWAGCPP